MNAFKISLFAGALLATSGAAAAQPAGNARGAAEITREQAAERAEQRFARLDANRDGRLTVEEARQGNGPRMERRQARRAQRQAQGQAGSRLIARLDANRDGQISREEFGQRGGERSARRFERLDANRDGQVSREELAQRRAQRGERRGARAEQRTAQRAERRAARIQQRAERRFGSDGVITLAEFKARALQRFERMDGNRDGRVTMAERRETRQHLRQERRARRQAPAQN